jgi:hypothetical protein
MRGRQCARLSVWNSENNRAALNFPEMCPGEHGGPGDGLLDESAAPVKTWTVCFREFPAQKDERIVKVCPSLKVRGIAHCPATLRFSIREGL